MAYIDDFIKATEKTAEMIAGKSIQFAKDTAKRTRLLAKIAKLNTDILVEKETVRKYYYQLGRLCYARYKNEPPEDMAEAIGDIRKSRVRIKKYREQIEALKAMNQRECKEEDDYEDDAAEEEVIMEIEIEETAEDTEVQQDDSTLSSTEVFGE